jgi:hypothetical protein
MNTFYEHHKSSVKFAYRCFDRILLNGLICEPPVFHCCLGYTPVNWMLESKFIFRNTRDMADSSLGSTFRTSSL